MTTHNPACKEYYTGEDKKDRLCSFTKKAKTNNLTHPDCLFIVNIYSKTTDRL